jgi:hypothetical protein
MGGLKIALVSGSQNDSNHDKSQSPEPGIGMRRCARTSSILPSQICSKFGTFAVGEAFIKSNILWRINMFAKHFAAGLVATALLTTTAIAQAPAPAAKDPPSGQSSSVPRADATPAKPEQMQSSSEWRASKVIGLYVYNDANERLGSINELLTDSSGKVVKAVIGVGGFLGIGESDVAVNFDQLKFVNEPMRTATTTSTPPAGSSSTTGSGTVGTSATTTTTTTMAAKPTINPDHAKLSMTKEQLKALPQFKYAN